MQTSLNVFVKSPGIDFRMIGFNIVIIFQISSLEPEMLIYLKFILNHGGESRFLARYPLRLSDCKAIEKSTTQLPSLGQPSLFKDSIVPEILENFLQRQLLKPMARKFPLYDPGINSATGRLMINTLLLFSNKCYPTEIHRFPFEFCWL